MCRFYIATGKTLTASGDLPSDRGYGTTPTPTLTFPDFTKKVIENRANLPTFLRHGSRRALQITARFSAVATANKSQKSTAWMCIRATLSFAPQILATSSAADCN
jgi:hypothetical protein